MSPEELGLAHDALEASIRGVAELIAASVQGRIQDAGARGDHARVEELSRQATRAIEAGTRHLARQLAALPPRPTVMPGAALAHIPAPKGDLFL